MTSRSWSTRAQRTACSHCAGHTQCKYLCFAAKQARGADAQRAGNLALPGCYARSMLRSSHVRDNYARHGGLPRETLVRPLYRTPISRCFSSRTDRPDVDAGPVGHVAHQQLRGAVPARRHIVRVPRARARQRPRCVVQEAGLGVRCIALLWVSWSQTSRNQQAQPWLQSSRQSRRQQSVVDVRLCNYAW